MFETERCSVHTFRESDSGDIKKLYADPEVRKFLGGIRSEESTEAVIEEMLNLNPHSFYWTAREKHTGSFLGLVSLTPHHEGVNQEVSYQFLPCFWGKGYAAEVVSAIISFAFNELHLSAVIAETQTANKASCRLLERLGMELEKTVHRFGAGQSVYSVSALKQQ